MKYHYLFFIFLSVLFGGCQPKNSTKLLGQLSVRNQSGKIGIGFHGIDRITGMKPIFEHSDAEFSVSSMLKPERIQFSTSEKQTVSIRFQATAFNNIIGISLEDVPENLVNGKIFSGVFADSLPGYHQGVQLWRYKPWNSWTKPIKVDHPADLEDWDVQFFYWQYEDGLYGAAIPLSGNGYRTTLGNDNGRFGSKSYTYIKGANNDSIPLMAVGFGVDAHQLFHDLYVAGMNLMKKPENLRENKKYPEPFEYIGWCTWNSSHNGTHLNEEHLYAGVKTFKDASFPLGWLLIDDGWFQHTNRQLNSLYPDPAKFPNGFKSLVQTMKNTYQLKHVGLWHAYNGYWNGINPDSDLGRKYKDNLFSWRQKYRPDFDEAPIVEYQFINPKTLDLQQFYNEWHAYMKTEGISMIKVDNQLVSENMCVDNLPIWDLAESMHNAIYQSAFSHFDGAVINCMDMTNDAFYNFGQSAIARCVEDYFPERDGGIGYHLERGGAAAHVSAALYNSLYFSQMVWPDYDMFESHNSHADFHAVARAISGGPVYITDIPGKQNFNRLKPLINSDGRIYRTDVPGQLTEDCLFQVQDALPLKAYSIVNGSGVLAAWNAADTSLVEGSFSLSQIKGIRGERFLVFEHFSKEWQLADKNDSLRLKLKRMQVQYYNVVPLKDGFAALGNINKYNAPGTIKKIEFAGNSVMIELDEAGLFAAYSETKPQKVLVDGNESTNYYFKNEMIFVPISSETDQPIKIKVMR